MILTNKSRATYNHVLNDTQHNKRPTLEFRASANVDTPHVHTHIHSTHTRHNTVAEPMPSAILQKTLLFIITNQIKCVTLPTSYTRKH